MMNVKLFLDRRAELRRGTPDTAQMVLPMTPDELDELLLDMRPGSVISTWLHATETTGEGIRVFGVNVPRML